MKYDKQINKKITITPDMEFLAATTNLMNCIEDTETQEFFETVLNNMSTEALDRLVCKAEAELYNRAKGNVYE